MRAAETRVAELAQKTVAAPAVMKVAAPVETKPAESQTTPGERQRKLEEGPQ